MTCQDEQRAAELWRGTWEAGLHQPHSFRVEVDSRGRAAGVLSLAGSQGTHAFAFLAWLRQSTALGSPPPTPPPASHGRCGVPGVPAGLRAAAAQRGRSPGRTGWRRQLKPPRAGRLRPPSLRPQIPVCECRGFLYFYIQAVSKVRTGSVTTVYS